jgi:hypothetical protein
MGIRIKKMIGWGLEVEEEDPRVDFEVLREGIYDSDQLNLADYRAFLEELYEEDKAKDFNDRDLDLMSEVKFLQQQDEMFIGEPNNKIRIRETYLHDAFEAVGNSFPWTLCIAPIHYARSWKRYDDTIDYVEATLDQDWDTTISWPDNNPFPYNDLFWSTHDFSRISRGEVIDARVMGNFDDIAPIVPTSVIRIAEWTGILSEEDARRLRPVYIQYWI